MSISMIWAMGANGVIGKDNDMPGICRVILPFLNPKLLAKEC